MIAAADDDPTSSNSFRGVRFSAPRGSNLRFASVLLDCHLPRYTLHFGMAIRRFRHKGLGRFFTEGSTGGIQSKHAPRLRLILGRLSVAAEPRDMGLPGLALHPLKGTRHGTWAVSVSGSWRVTFRFEGPDATDVDYEDYH
jgi:toxin HigB-1